MPVKVPWLEKLPTRTALTASGLGRQRARVRDLGLNALLASSLRSVWAMLANIDTPSSLRSLLADQLPKDVPFRFYHYSTPPTRSAALFSAPPHAKPERTYCESHFLAASILPSDAADARRPEELLILAIEVLVYTTRNLTTIFVSKADSTGALSELQLPRSQLGSPLKAICGTFVAWLARERQREGKKLVLSLFARAQDQYLFPASIENKNKHVLDDRGLVKWWCRVLDPVVWQYKAEEQRKPFAERLFQPDVSDPDGPSRQPESTAQGYLIIPGFEPYDTLRYTPAPPANTPRRWTAAHPLLHIAPHPAAPPRCLIPHFPDDPKTRFLDELDEELPDRGTDAMVEDGGTPSRSDGQWKSVKTLDQFWEFMAFRQECSSGRIVGFIWVVINPPKHSITKEDEDEPSQQSLSQETVASPRSKKPRRPKREDKIKYGPIPLVLPKIKTTTSSLFTKSFSSTTPSDRTIPSTSPYYTWNPSSRGKICFSAKNYDRAHQVLLQQSFANRAATSRSTEKWKHEIAVLGGMSDWSWTVVGRKETVAPAAHVTPPTLVVGVRKKRKTQPSVDLNSAESQHEPGVSGIGEVSVKKKLKVDSEAGDRVSGINTLSTGLVRKKPKT